jgi:tetratricopeptide (TPR) repeat protein
VKRGIDDVAETLRMAREREKSCALLIGAGCSVTAGIPAASGIVSYIQRRYRRGYDRAAEKTYPLCMAELLPGERRDLIAKYVDPAQVNWAHVCIAQLMKKGYVDRILTTNFDPLVIRACALLGLFPAVYDFAASQTFKAGDIPREAIVYLHGQRSGFVLLNTRKEVHRHAKLLKPVFAEAGQGRVWLVAGYSGESDPVFDRLAEYPGFDNGLYWVGYPEPEPPPHVSKRLVDGKKDAFYVGGFDADSFFIALLQKLDCFPPDFIGRPFSYLDQLMETLAPYTPPGGASGPDFTGPIRSKINDAIQRYERGQAAETERVAQNLLLGGKLEELERMPSEVKMTPEVASSVAWAHVLEGNGLGDTAKTLPPDEAKGLFAAAFEKYEHALAIKPEMHEALYNWGTTLLEQARASSAAEADALFAAACEKYDQALAIEPDVAALGNLANALVARARARTGPEAERLLDEAARRYADAEAISPGSASYNLACLSAWRGDAREARRWLERSKDHGFLPSAAHLAGDPDLDPVRDEAWFAELVGISPDDDGAASVSPRGA